MYRIWVEEIFGFHLRGDILNLNPILPKKWETAKIHYKYRSFTYIITYENPEHINRGMTSTELDGIQLPDNQIHLIDDGQIHRVRVIINPLKTSDYKCQNAKPDGRPLF